MLAISLTISKKLISVPLHSPISEMNIHVICHDGWPNGDKSEVTLKEKMEACMYQADLITKQGYKFWPFLPPGAGGFCSIEKRGRI